MVLRTKRLAMLSSKKEFSGPAPAGHLPMDIMRQLKRFNSVIPLTEKIDRWDAPRRLQRTCARSHSAEISALLSGDLSAQLR